MPTAAASPRTAPGRIVIGCCRGAVAAPADGTPAITCRVRALTCDSSWIYGHRPGCHQPRQPAGSIVRET